MISSQSRNNRIQELTISFSLLIIPYCKLLEGKGRPIIARQVFRSGTSIGAFVREAQNAESRTDFIHKIKIAAKEAEETEYWLILSNGSKNYFPCDKLLVEIRQIILILSSILKTAKTNLHNQ